MRILIIINAGLAGWVLVIGIVAAINKDRNK